MAWSTSTAGELPAKLAGRTSSDVASMQIVFQNPDSALNRRHRVSRLIGRSLKKLIGLTGATRREAGARS